MQTRTFSAACLLFSAMTALLAVQGAADPPAPHMLMLDNGKIRIGVNLSIGGAITWLSRSGSSVNMVNSHDWGRQIQMSCYSGPTPYEPDGKKPMPAWAGLGWNPIQSGDSYQNPSRVVSYRLTRHSIFVQCIPMHWPLNNEPAHCVYSCRIRLKGRAALIDCSIVNNRRDKTQYPAHDQEMPAVYVNAPWYRIFAYTGSHPYTHGALARIPSKFMWSGFNATEHWAAMVDKNGNGLGVWHPGATRFAGGFFGRPGKGGPKDNPTGYTAPLHREILDWNIVTSYHYRLILGSLQQIRNYVYAHTPASQRTAPPRFVFNHSRCYWRYINASDTGWPLHGGLHVLLHSGAQIASPILFYHAGQAPMLKMHAAFTRPVRALRVYWRAFGAGYSGENSMELPVMPDGKMHTVYMRLGDSAQYRGIITGLRLAPDTGGENGGQVMLRSLALVKDN